MRNELIDSKEWGLYKNNMNYSLGDVFKMCDENKYGWSLSVSGKLLVSLAEALLHILEMRRINESRMDELYD